MKTYIDESHRNINLKGSEFLCEVRPNHRRMSVEGFYPVVMFDKNRQKYFAYDFDKKYFADSYEQAQEVAGKLLEN